MRKYYLPCRLGRSGLLLLAVVKLLAVVMLPALTACQLIDDRYRDVDRQRVVVEQSNANLAGAQALIQGFHQLPYEQVLVAGSATTYQHDAQLPAMMIDGHRSFVKGFEVDAATPLTTLRLKSFAWQGGRFGRAANRVILFPSVVLLGEQFQVLADFKRPSFQFEGRSRFKEAMVTSINMGGNARYVRYIVIYVSAENRIGTFQYCRNGNGVVRFKQTSIPVFEGVPCFSLPFNMEGRLEVFGR